MCVHPVRIHVCVTVYCVDGCVFESTVHVHVYVWHVCKCVHLCV